MRKAAIDELLLHAAPLGARMLVAPSLSIQFPIVASPKPFVQAVPLFASRPPIAADNGAWPAYCNVLKNFGIPLQAAVDALDSLPVAAVPPRFARRLPTEGYDALELETAEALQIYCISAQRVAELPWEVGDWNEFRTQIECLRQWSNGKTPIGLVMLAGDVVKDVTNAVGARVDFIVLEMPSAGQSEDELDFVLWCVAAARRACVRAGVPAFPIYVDAAVSLADDFVKLFALGATALSIDHLAASLLSTTPSPAANPPKGMLSGISVLTPPPPPSMAPLERKLTELLTDIQLCLEQRQLSQLSDLSQNHLRALSSRAARLAGVTLLDHRADDQSI